MVTVAGPDRVASDAQRWRSRARMRVLGLLLGAALALTGLAAYRLVHDSGQAAPAPAAVKPVWTRQIVAAGDLPATLGIRLTQVAVTGGGGLIDLRFQVVDAELASAIHDPNTPPAVVLEPSGLFLDQLLMGHEHSGAYHPAETYYLLFLNSGGWVHAGDRVTVLLGGVQVADLKVA